jgi:putative intracellular protease/amidase
MALLKAAAPNGRPVVVLLYPGCIFFEIALAAETLAERGARIVWLTPQGTPHHASNGAHLSVDGDYPMLRALRPAAVLIPGGDPRAILLPDNLVRAPLEAALQHGALLAGICAGNLVLAASGFLRGRRGTHNYTSEFAPPEQVAATAAVWAGMAYERADLVEDGPFITAMPWAYRAYAAAVGRRLGLLDAAAAERVLRYPERTLAARAAR